MGWREQVRLGSAEVITIEREVVMAGGGAAWPQGQGSIPRQHVIRFKPDPGKDALTEWRSFKLDSSTYAELPIVLDVTQGKSWFIFTALSLNAGCVQYLKYELRNGTWHEVRLEERIGIQPSNLTLRAGSVEIDPLVSLAAKAVDLLEHKFNALKKKVGPRRFECNDLYRGPYPPRDAV